MPLNVTWGKLGSSFLHACDYCRVHMHANAWGRTFKDPFSPEFSSQIYGIGFFDSRTFQHAGMPPLLSNNESKTWNKSPVIDLCRGLILKSNATNNYNTKASRRMRTVLVDEVILAFEFLHVTT